MSEPARYIYRLNNLHKATDRLIEALSKSGHLSSLEKEGIIKRFELTHELAWKGMKDILLASGVEVYGSRDTTRKAFQAGLLEDGEIWFKMIETRNQTVHD